MYKALGQRVYINSLLYYTLLNKFRNLSSFQLLFSHKNTQISFLIWHFHSKYRKIIFYLKVTYLQPLKIKAAFSLNHSSVPSTVACYRIFFSFRNLYAYLFCLFFSNLLQIQKNLFASQRYSYKLPPVVFRFSEEIFFGRFLHISWPLKDK